MNTQLKALLVALLIFCALTFNCTAESAPTNSNPLVLKPQLTGVFTLPRMSLQLFAPTNYPYDLELAHSNGLRFTDLPSIGSGLARRTDRALFGITDRGPNSSIKVSKKNEKRVMSLPDFCPAIVRIVLTNGEIHLPQIILLKDSDGNPLTGLNNSPDEESGFASPMAAQPLPPNPSGIDPESIRCLPDGKFILGEEYSPSIFVVNTNGEVLVRYTPKSKPLAGAHYPVQTILPDILRERRPNRGFENLALSRDGKTAYAILQSPMGDDKDPRYADSRIIRAVELDLGNPIKARVTGMFLLRASPYTDYPECKRQNQVKLNDAEWLAPRKLLLLEQAKGRAQLIVADFNNATDVLNNPDAETLRFEDVSTDLAALKISPAKVTSIFSTAEIPAIDSDKLEGLVLLGGDEIALSNDNDFGIGDNTSAQPSKVWTIRLPALSSFKP